LVAFVRLTWSRFQDRLRLSPQKVRRKSALACLIEPIGERVKIAIE